jgi:hypothetical protein
MAKTKRCMLHKRRVLNTNRKPWSSFRLVTSLRVSHDPSGWNRQIATLCLWREIAYNSWTVYNRPETCIWTLRGNHGPSIIWRRYFRSRTPASGRSRYIAIMEIPKIDYNYWLAPARDVYEPLRGNRGQTIERRRNFRLKTTPGGRNQQTANKD